MADLKCFRCKKSMGTSPNPDEYEFMRCQSCVGETKKQLEETNKRIDEKYENQPKTLTPIQRMEQLRAQHGGKMALSHKELLGR